VKVDYLGETQYLYGFSATPTGRSAGDNATPETSSYSGNYEVTIREPGSLAILLTGLFGLVRLRTQRR